MVTRFAGSGVRGTAKDGTNSSAIFGWAIYCTTDNYGNIYVADGQYLRMVSQSGEVNTLANFGTSVLAQYGLLMNGSDDVMISFWDSSFVGSYSLKSRELTDIAGNISALVEEGFGLLTALDRPSGLTFDELGNLYVSQGPTSSIWKINKTNYVSLFAGPGYGTPGVFINGIGTGARFSDPRQLVFDSKGRIFVTDSGNAAIRMLNW